MLAKTVPSSSVTPMTTSLTHSSLSPRSNLRIVSRVHGPLPPASGSSASDNPERLCVALCRSRSCEAGAARRAARRAEGEEVVGSTPREVRMGS